MIMANAQRVSSALYNYMRTLPQLGELPDGTELLVLSNGWVFRVFDDPGDDAPNGISWYLDSPRERGVDSGGWESLTLPDLDGPEIVSLAAHLDTVMEQECEEHDAAE